MIQQRIEMDAAALRLEQVITLAKGPPMSVPQLIAEAEGLKAAGRKADVIALYRNWLAHHDDDPLYYAAAFNLAVSLGELGDKAGALIALRDTIRAKPDFPAAHINLGGMLDGIGQQTKAIGVWAGLVERFAGANGEALKYKIMGLNQIGRVHETAQNDEAAEHALALSLEIDPAQPEAMQHWIALRQRQCKWPVLEVAAERTSTLMLAGMSPLTAACFSDDPLFQLAKAHRYNKSSIATPPDYAAFARALRPARGQRDKLRIGYVSSDLRDHAVGFSMTEIVELHDRKRFDVHAYYCGISSPDTTQRRIRAGVDHWNDLAGQSDLEAAERIRRDGIDILVDLNGYTKDARTKVFAYRPAPIAVNWFGFPSTMGSPYHHYIIADEHVIPAGDEIHYSEKVLRLACYQPNDRKRAVTATPVWRSDEGLPNGAVVFCCLNGMQKLNAATFQSWMQILAAVSESVLWLLSGTSDTNLRLRARAAAAGIDPARLIFADKKANPDHLARYRLADLFLDTFPYGAHTTASDSLWMGTPILTISGKTFASRVCGSLLHAAGLGELVTTTRHDYVARAIELGSDPARLADLKRRLVDGRDSCALFDTPKLVRDLENLYETMWRDFEEGRRPQPDLTNLDVYHDVALMLDHEAGFEMDARSNTELYRRHLADIDLFAPLPPDGRMWRDTGEHPAPPPS